MEDEGGGNEEALLFVEFLLANFHNFFLNYARILHPPRAAISKSSLTSTHILLYPLNHHLLPPHLSFLTASTLCPPQVRSAREYTMSLEFGAPGSGQVPHGLYGQGDLDQALSGLQNGDRAAHHNMSSGMVANGYDHGETLDVPEQGGYDMYSNPQSPSSFTNQRYRTNASSSSSLGPNYTIGSDAMFAHPFADSAPSFAGGNPYELGHSLPQSYSSGKISPLTPNDNMQQHTLFNGGKDYSAQNGYPSLLPDRRSVNGYPSEYSEDFAMNPNQGVPYPDAHRYQERFQNDPRFAGVPPQMQHHNHGPDILRGVAPQSTHSQGYEDMQYMPTNGLHMQGASESLSQMRLAGPTGASPSSDLQSFIRSV